MSRSESQAFDLVELGGDSAAAEPWPERRRRVDRLLIELSRSRDLEAAIRLALEGVSRSLGWSMAYARWEIDGQAGNLWLTDGADSSELDALEAALDRGPVAGLADQERGRPLVRLEALISLPETRAREAARNASLQGYASLPVLAEGRPVALLEFFSPASPEDAFGSPRASEVRDLLEIVAGSLALLASRARMIDAVRSAAQFARRQARELVEAQSQARSRGEGDPELYDERTGFPRPVLLFDRIRQAIKRRQRSPADQFAVLVAQLDGMDRIRDWGGDQGVEDILVAAGRRLSARARPADTIGVSPDGHFVMLIEGIGAIDEAVRVAERAQKELQRPFPMTHDDVRIETRIGVVLGGPAYDDPEILLADANSAAARASGTLKRVQVFDRTVEDNHQLRERLRNELGRALERSEFYVEYQPIVSLHDGRITGLETFMRWRHPELGVVPPGDFIPVAADSSLIHDIGFWVLREVCEQINSWRSHLGSTDTPPVGINVTARQLYAKDFLEQVREVLEQHGIKGRQIRFDVREQDLMRDAGKAARVLDRLQGMGIEVAVDDFGTGFSSLSLLHDLPVGALKIDRSFVSHRRERMRKWGVARTIVELAKILEVDVIAEGIETREQFITLRRAGCTQAQGYHFSGPVNAEAAEAMIRDGYPLDLEAPAR